jgi:hypothetical protein
MSFANASASPRYLISRPCFSAESIIWPTAVLQVVFETNVPFWRYLILPLAKHGSTVDMLLGGSAINAAQAPTQRTRPSTQ